MPISSETTNGVAIINISNPSNPQNQGNISGTNNMILENLDTHGNLLAVAAHEDGVLLYDISNPTNPRYISTIDAENAWAVAVDDYHIYVADGSTILDYFKNENTGEYILLASIELSNAIKDIVIGGGYLYAAIGSDGVVVIDIEVNVTPQIIQKDFLGDNAAAPQTIPTSSRYIAYLRQKPSFE